jgi:ribosome-associated protein
LSIIGTSLVAAKIGRSREIENRNVGNLSFHILSDEGGASFCHVERMSRIVVTRAISIDSAELVESFTRAGGPGGQHVNTTDSAVLLRFDVAQSPNLPERVKFRLAEIAGQRMTRDGVLVLRSDGARSQEVNRRDVRERLIEMIREATIVPKARRATEPTRASQTRRVDAKARRGAIKSGRGRVRAD